MAGSWFMWSVNIIEGISQPHATTCLQIYGAGIISYVTITLGGFGKASWKNMENRGFSVFFLVFTYLWTSTNVNWSSRKNWIFESFYYFFLFNKFIWIKQIQLKSTIHSNSSMNSLGFLNEFHQIPQWIHSDSSINSLGFLNKFTRIPQWIH